MSRESIIVFTSTFYHYCWLVVTVDHLITIVTCVSCHLDFPPKKGAELDKVFQDLEDLLKI